MKNCNLLVMFLLGAQAHKTMQEHEPQLAIEKRQMIKDGLKQWPNRKVPYLIENTYNRIQRLAVARAIEEFRNKTCINWVERKDETDFVYFMLTPKGACYSDVGIQGGLQVIGLSAYCLTKLYVMLHEMMHAIGFHHEHQRTDRNKYVRIFPENIRRIFRHEMDIQNDTYPVTSYDYKSIMHYQPKSYIYDIKPKKGTIEPLDKKNVIQMGSTFSELDAKKIRMAYNCEPLRGPIF